MITFDRKARSRTRNLALLLVGVVGAIAAAAIATATTGPSITVDGGATPTVSATPDRDIDWP